MQGENKDVKAEIKKLEKRAQLRKTDPNLNHLTTKDQKQIMIENAKDMYHLQMDTIGYERGEAEDLMSLEGEVAILREKFRQFTKSIPILSEGHKGAIQLDPSNPSHREWYEDNSADNLVYKELSPELREKLKESAVRPEVKDGKLLFDRNNEFHRYIMEDNVDETINPAIAYTEETKTLDTTIPQDADRWEYLYKKRLDECTHKHADGSSSWNQISDNLYVCYYCRIND